MELSGRCILFLYVVLSNLFNLGASQWQIWLGKSVEMLISCAFCVYSEFTWGSFKFFSLLHQKLQGFPQEVWKIFINKNINSVAFVILCTLDLYVRTYYFGYLRHHNIHKLTYLCPLLVGHRVGCHHFAALGKCQEKHLFHPLWESNWCFKTQTSDKKPQSTTRIWNNIF